MKWDVGFYDRKVMEGIQKWPSNMKAKFIWIVDLIEKFGPQEIGMPHVKAMSKGLFEIRARGNEGIGRALFCIKGNRRIIILNGFIKKTQKTPQKEIDLARVRMEEVKDEKKA